MSENLTAKYVEILEKDGPDGSFEFVYNTCSKKVRLRINYKLKDWVDKVWGRCDDPANHTFGITQNTFINFYSVNLKLFENKNTKEIINLWGLLYRISNNKISEHFKLRICKSFPPTLTKNLDDVDPESLTKKGGYGIEDLLLCRQAKDSLPTIYRDALEDHCIRGLTHNEIAIKRGITPAASKKRTSMAIRKFRRFYGI